MTKNVTLGLSFRRGSNFILVAYFKTKKKAQVSFLGIGFVKNAPNSAQKEQNPPFETAHLALGSNFSCHLLALQQLLLHPSKLSLHLHKKALKKDSSERDKINKVPTHLQKLNTR